MYCDDLIVFSPLCDAVLRGSEIFVRQSFAAGTGLAEMNLMVKNAL